MISLKRLVFRGSITLVVGVWLPLFCYAFEPAQPTTTVSANIKLFASASCIRLYDHAEFVVKCLFSDADIGKRYLLVAMSRSEFDGFVANPSGLAPAEGATDCITLIVDQLQKDDRGKAFIGHRRPGEFVVNDVKVPVLLTVNMSEDALSTGRVRVSAAQVRDGKITCLSENSIDLDVIGGGGPLVPTSRGAR